MIIITVRVEFTRGGVELSFDTKASPDPNIDSDNQKALAEMMTDAVAAMASSVAKMKLTDDLKEIIAKIAVTHTISDSVSEIEKAIEGLDENDPNLSDKLAEILKNMLNDKLGGGIESLSVEEIPEEDVPQEFKDYFDDKKGSKKKGGKS